MTQNVYETLVIGAGQAGLATGYHLQRAGADFAILEAGVQPGGSWPYYYESLRLFSPARFSALPGLPFPGDPERYPTRDEVIAYLQEYAVRFRLPILFNARVAQVVHSDGQFQIQTTDGRIFTSTRLIAASGSFQHPHLPAIAGQEQFAGAILHSFAYRTPASFAGQRIVVVGGGNSAVQIAAELARVARVSLAVREPVRFVAQRPYGRDVHFWWSLLRLDTSPIDHPLGRLFARLADGKGPRVLDAGVYQQALTAGKPDTRPMFHRFTDHGVVWADGQAEAVDTVIFATGYRPGLDYLAPLGALDSDGQPIHRYGVSTVIPGLGFVGMMNQRTFASAALRGVGADAAVVLRALHRQQNQRAFNGLRQRFVCCEAGSPA